MSDVILMRVNGSEKNAHIIRYFLYNHQRYLIFSLDELDDGGYMKLYVCKVIDSLDGIATMNIIDEVEWDDIKTLIKTIISEVRMGTLTSIEDIDYKELHNISVASTRAFKLLPNVAEILGQDKKVFVEETVPEQEIHLDSKDLDYKDLYFKEIQGRKEVEEELNEALQTIERYKVKLENIRKMIEEV